MLQIFVCLKLASQMEARLKTPAGDKRSRRFFTATLGVTWPEGVATAPATPREPRATPGVDPQSLTERNKALLVIGKYPWHDG